MDDPPELFVARDRARRLGFRLEKVLQERRLAWQGDDVGMSSLRDEADLDLLGIATDARASAAAVLDGRLRDRERGYMEVPFAVMAVTVALRLEEAARLEADRRAGLGAVADLPGEILDLLGLAATRLEAFQATYDLKRVLGEPRPVDVARLLGQASAGPGRAYDHPPPVLKSDAGGLGDLLLAVRQAVGDGAGGWHVETGDGALRLKLGETGGEVRSGEVPEEVLRAAQVLEWLHPVKVLATTRARALGGDELAGLEVCLEDPGGASLELSVEALAGGPPTFSAGEERAVRALLQAPRLEDGDGSPPPARLVALLGVLQAFDQALTATILPRFTARAVRSAAEDLPREATRKAPLKAKLVQALEAEFPDLSFARAGDLLQEVARSRRALKLGPRDVAMLLGIFGRTWHLAGIKGEAPLPRGNLDEGDIDALIRDLATIDQVRPRLEAGQEIPAADLTRLEAATLGALGRLRRM